MSEYIKMKLHNGERMWGINKNLEHMKYVSHQLMEDGIPEASINQIFDNATEILSKCPSPSDEQEFRQTGIVIGKVQSGKTSNFAALIALALDNQYNLIIVFGGNKKNLVDQNASRINSYFNSNNSSNGRVVVLSTDENANMINSKTVGDFIQNGRKVIVVGLKHEKHINLITDIFDTAFLMDQAVLIIDDEGDQATLNTKVNKKKFSTTYQSIILLKQKIRRHCFISVTATPQANILIQTCDALSPDFGMLVYPGDDYCGLSEFHGKDESLYLRTIAESEPNLLEREGVPESLYFALALFFVGSAIRIYRGDLGYHSMLIHPSQKRGDHEIVNDIVMKIIEKWKELAREKKNGVEDIAYNGLVKWLNQAYCDLKTSSLNCPKFEELENDILESISQCGGPHICNSDQDATENAKFYKINIFVGGNMVERGITFNGLATTYIMRRPKGTANLDNTEQRARWFGYKKNFIDVCRIFATQVIREDFLDIYEHDEDLWSMIERIQKQGIEFKEMPRLFKLNNKKMSLTRKNVAKSERYTFSEWTKQNYLNLSAEEAKINSMLIQHFREANQDNEKKVIFTEHNTHYLYEEYKFSYIVETLIKNMRFPAEGDVNHKLFDKLLEGWAKYNLDPETDLLFVRYDKGSERSLRSDGKINNLFEGRNPNADKESRYPGDSAMIMEGRSHAIQLQIHRVKPKNHDDFNEHAIALALFIPAAIIEKLVALIGQSGE